MREVTVFESRRRSLDRGFGRRVVPMDVEAEVDALVRECRRLGTMEDRGVVVKFGLLVRDEQCANIFEALNGTGGEKEEEDNVRGGDALTGRAR